MSNRIVLELENRTILGKKVATLRRTGVLPATVYGRNIGPFAVQLNAKFFNEVLRRAGRTTLIDLKVPGQAPMSGFIHNWQRHPISRAIIHVEFHVVDLAADVTVAVPIHITGTSALVARGDAILNIAMNALDVRALPTEIPAHIEIDVSDLDSMDKSIHVRDITLPASISMASAPDELVIGLSVTGAGAAAAETESAAEPELVRGKREAEE